MRAHACSGCGWAVVAGVSIRPIPAAVVVAAGPAHGQVQGNCSAMEGCDVAAGGAPMPGASEHCPAADPSDCRYIAGDCTPSAQDDTFIDCSDFETDGTYDEVTSYDTLCQNVTINEIAPSGIGLDPWCYTVPVVCGGAAMDIFTVDVGCSYQLNDCTCTSGRAGDPGVGLSCNEMVAEVCGNDVDDDCDGYLDDEDACELEVCGNLTDDDGDGLVDEECATECEQCGRCEGKPVDLVTR